MIRIKAVCEWFNTPYYNGVWFEPKPWQSVMFTLFLIMICCAVTLVIWEIVDSHSFSVGFVESVVKFIIY